MKTVKNPGELKNGEFYMMECNSGYHSYYSFGTEPKELFKNIGKMYNGYCNACQYNSKTFRKLCLDDGYSVFLYKIDIRFPFFFNDDVWDISDNKNVVCIGDYLEMTERSEIK